MSMIQGGDILIVAFNLPGDASSEVSEYLLSPPNLVFQQTFPTMNGSGGLSAVSGALAQFPAGPDIIVAGWAADGFDRALWRMHRDGTSEDFIVEPSSSGRDLRFVGPIRFDGSGLIYACRSPGGLAGDAHIYRYLADGTYDTTITVPQPLAGIYPATPSSPSRPRILDINLDPDGTYVYGVTAVWTEAPVASGSDVTTIRHASFLRWNRSSGMAVSVIADYTNTTVVRSGHIYTRTGNVIDIPVVAIQPDGTLWTFRVATTETYDTVTPFHLASATRTFYLDHRSAGGVFIETLEIGSSDPGYVETGDAFNAHVQGFVFDTVGRLWGILEAQSTTFYDRRFFNLDLTTHTLTFFGPYTDGGGAAGWLIYLAPRSIGFRVSAALIT